MNRPMSYYIAHNDFEGAVARLENTSPCWRAKWFAVCEQIFNSCTEWGKKYFLDPVAKVVRRLSEVLGKRKSKYDEHIFVSDDCPTLNNDAKEKCYLFEFFDADWHPICAKVGTTTRPCVTERLREELRSKTYKKMGAEYAVIQRVYDCKDRPAEGLESYVRAQYIKKYPDSFKKNDRFMLCHFDLAEIDKLYNKYFDVA